MLSKKKKNLKKLCSSIIEQKLYKQCNRWLSDSVFKISDTVEFFFATIILYITKTVLHSTPFITVPSSPGGGSTA